MNFSAFNGTRFGAFLQTLLYLTGIPRLVDYEDANPRMKQSPTTFSFDSLNPTAHIEDPENVRCYGILGCLRVKYAAQRGFHLFPEPLKIIKPTICLQLHQNRTCQPIEPETVKNMVVSPGKKSYWITHGYIDTGHKPWTQKMTNELLEYDHDCNVYVIDWGRGAEPPYSQAAMNVELLGAYVGHLMILIEDTYGLPINETHFIGHSLGAHFGGFVGSWLNERGFLLGRISGLDPAQPYFQEYEPDVRLDPSDAMFVDVIHTDAEPLLAGGSLTGLGTQEPSGHVDFYPNSGKEQPGCGDGVYQAILQEKGSLLYGLRRFFGCNHIRSYEIFIESIRSPCPFMAFMCSDWEAFLSGSCLPACDNEDEAANCNRMGFHARKPSIEVLESTQAKPNEDHSNKTYLQPPKVYYAITGNRSPYCREHYMVSLELGEKSVFRTNSDLNLLLLGRNGVLDKMKLGARDLRESVSFQYVVPGHGFRGSVQQIILKSSASNPLWWLMNKIVRNPDITVNSISLLNMESKREIIFCPKGPPYLRMAEENNNILLTSSACSPSLSNVPTQIPSEIPVSLT